MDSLVVDRQTGWFSKLAYSETLSNFALLFHSILAIDIVIVVVICSFPI